ncbi:MAG: hypothetical protein MHM6MM_005843 [Cercozoa sp. M6MM]
MAHLMASEITTSGTDLGDLHLSRNTSFWTSRKADCVLMLVLLIIVGLVSYVMYGTRLDRILLKQIMNALDPGPDYN